MSRALGAAGAAVLVAVLPLYLDGFWLQTGLFAMAAAVAAIGLTLLVGVAGQLSLGHAFFVAVGAYGYCALAGGEPVPGVESPGGLELPPVVALAGAVVVAGAAGAAFSPIAGRLRGIYLGLASIGLVFLGQHVLLNATGLTGGSAGRDAPPLRLLGFGFEDGDPPIVVLGVAFGQFERLWYLGAALLAASAWVATNVVRGRPGLALAGVRDNELAAAAMGVDVRRHKAAAFCWSSMYAGLGGALMALTYGRIVPESFGLVFSIQFLAMVVLGGLGSVGGAIAGAFLVSALPSVLDHYSDGLPLLSEPGAGGVEPADLARFLYGAAIVGVVLFAPRGLSGVRTRLQRRGAPAGAVQPPS